MSLELLLDVLPLNYDCVYLIWQQVVDYEARDSFPKWSYIIQYKVNFELAARRYAFLKDEETLPPIIKSWIYADLLDLHLNEMYTSLSDDDEDYETYLSYAPRPRRTWHFYLDYDGNPQKF